MPIDAARAADQHARYEAALVSLGVTVRRAPAAPDLPDAVFIEDTAIVLDELAVIARPGAASRRPEVEPVAAMLGAYRPLVRIEAPATLDGGDVLRVGRTLYVGRSARSSAEGIAQLGALVEPHGYRVAGVPMDGCLHLKSAVTLVGERTLLLNPAWVSGNAFADCDAIEVDPAEPHGANALLVRETVIYPEHLPRTMARLRARGVEVVTVPADELAKAEGGVTCCSLLFDVARHGRAS